MSDVTLLPSDAAVQQVAGAIRLSAHVRYRNPGPLASQLRGRLLADPDAGVQALCAGCLGYAIRSFLLPMTASLTAAGRPLLRVMEGHTDSVTSVAINPNGRQVASASRDNTLRVWDREIGETLGMFRVDAALTSCAYSPDGDLIVACDQAGQVHFLRFEH